MYKKFKHENLIVSPAPHQVSDITTQKIMAQVILALMPSFFVTVWFYGARAIFLLGLCVTLCMVFEYLFEIITKRPNTVSDLSAAVTGVLLAFNLPVTLPYWMAAIGCFVAIVITKQLFGGIGQNFANPAITARIVLFLSFPKEMMTWAVPGRIFLATDAVTGATPLGLMNHGETEGFPSMWDMFIGNIGGSMGEISAAALLIGGVFLLIRKIINPAIPLSFIGTVALFAWLTGENPLFHVLAGGVMLGAFFMATDYATSPLTTRGKILFGVGCGGLSMLIRVYSSYPEGVSFAILIMNILVPHIDSLSKKSLYGGG
jgi:electron transport complex protein RnfD